MIKKKLIISVVINFLIFVTTIFSIIHSFFAEAVGNMEGYARWGIFVFFTIDSNLFCALASLAIGFYNLIKLIRNDFEKESKVLDLLKFISTVAVGLTFITVILFLVFIYGASVLIGDNFVLHLSSPILAIISYMFFDSKIPNKTKEVFLGLLPIIIYGAVYITMTVFIGHDNGGWYDFYMFNLGGMWFITVIVMLLVTFGIAFVINFGKIKYIQRINNHEKDN